MMTMKTLVMITTIRMMMTMVVATTTLAWMMIMMRKIDTDEYVHRLRIKVAMIFGRLFTNITIAVL